MKSEQFYIFLVFKQSNQSILDFEIFKQIFRMQFKFLEKTPLRTFSFLPMYTHWILHFGGLRTLNHEPNKQCDRLLIGDSPMNVKASWWELQLFSQPKNMTTSMIRHLRIFGRHIYELCARLHWLQFKCTRRTYYF